MLSDLARDGPDCHHGTVLRMLAETAAFQFGFIFKIKRMRLSFKFLAGWLVDDVWMVGCTSTWAHFRGRKFGLFMDLGAFEVCHVTQHLSIYSTLFLLTSQALISRIVVREIELL